MLPQFTDTIANSRHIPNFDPFEINFDGPHERIATCHTWIYVQSANTGQVAILNSRDGVPVALIDSPTPGGIAVQVGNGSNDVLLVTNSGANTFTAFDIGSLTPGTQFLNGPLYIKKVQPTGNTPRAISVTLWGGGVSGWNRDGGNGGPSVPVIMYADFTDGTVNTITLSDTTPVRQFALGPSIGAERHRVHAVLRRHHVRGHQPGRYARQRQGGLLRGRAGLCDRDADERGSGRHRGGPWLVRWP